MNHDTYAYQERIALLHDCGGIDHLRAVAAAGRTPQVLEIGGGYGALVYHLQKLVPQARVVIVDLPESLVFSAVYVSLLRPKLRHVYLAAETPDRELKTVRPGCMFVPNFMFDRLLAAETDFDLVINTLSMSEMAREQVGYYCSGIRKLIGNHGGFFEQNQDNTVIGKLDARRVIADHFAERLVVNSESVSHPLHGSAHVWSNRPWRNAARLPPMALSRVARQSR